MKKRLITVALASALMLPSYAFADSDPFIITDHGESEKAWQLKRLSSRTPEYKNAFKEAYQAAGTSAYYYDDEVNKVVHLNELNIAIQTNIPFDDAVRNADDVRGKIADLRKVGSQLEEKEFVISPAPGSVITIGDQILNAGAEATILYFSDLLSHFDAETLSLKVETSDSAIVTAQMVGKSLTLTPIGAGNAIIQVTATDGDGKYAIITFSVDVSESDELFIIDIY